ncbi:MAG: hypothetical protein MJZ37_09990 [Bacilli bacterium]|nr:hypothetical protein [Bacilli bacterium]
MDVYKKIVVVGDKKYTNYYLDVGNEKLIPIQVKAIKKGDGTLCNKNDFAILNFIAKTVE